MDKKYKIAVGTKSEQKIGYLKEVLKELNINAEIIPNDVKSGVSDQPLTSEETKLGSINRAKEALNKNPKTDFAIGIEIGFHPDKNGKYEMFCWATIVDGTGYSVSKGSHKFLLPKYYQELFKENKNLSNHMMDYLKDTKNPMERRLAEMFIKRKTFINNAIEHALMLYLNKEEF